MQKWLPILLFAHLISTYSIAQLWEEPNMVRVITDSIPVPTNRIELCKTKEGREAIIASLDTLTKMDLRFQWEGIRMNDTSYKTTFHDFLLNHAAFLFCRASVSQLISCRDQVKESSAPEISVSEKTSAGSFKRWLGNGLTDPPGTTGKRYLIP